MNIINPTDGTPIPKLVMYEPFMLWCPARKAYNIVVVTDYGSSSSINKYKYVVKDTQSATVFHLKFTIRDMGSGRDLYKSLDVIEDLIKHNNYDFAYSEN